MVMTMRLSPYAQDIKIGKIYARHVILLKIIYITHRLQRAVTNVHYAIVHNIQTTVLHSWNTLALDSYTDTGMGIG